MIKLFTSFTVSCLNVFEIKGSVSTVRKFISKTITYFCKSLNGTIQEVRFIFPPSLENDSEVNVKEII